jgi:hypothetical protein
VSPLWFCEQHFVCDVTWHLKVSISLIMYKQLKLMIFCESFCIFQTLLLCEIHIYFKHKLLILSRHECFINSLFNWDLHRIWTIFLPNFLFHVIKSLFCPTTLFSHESCQNPSKRFQMPIRAPKTIFRVLSSGSWRGTDYENQWRRWVLNEDFFSLY